MPHIGFLCDSYDWAWGDALFVVIDSYWHSPEPVDNFVFSHHVLGTGRGGIERAR